MSHSAALPPTSGDDEHAPPIGGGIREDSALPELADDAAREDVLRLPQVRVDHAWTGGRLTSARLLDEFGRHLATVERVSPVRPEARFLWILGDIKSTRWFIRDPDDRLLWEVLRKPNAGGTKADMAPVPEAGVVRAIRGMPWSRNDFTLYASSMHGGFRIGTIRWSGGLFGQSRTVIDPAHRPVLETVDHGRGPWSDYTVRWTDDPAAVDPALRTSAFVSTVCLHTALTKVRN